jgi:hypothetical protein
MWINILNWLSYVIQIIIIMCGIWMIHRFIFMWQHYLSQVKMMVRWSRKWEFQFPMTLTYMIIIKLDTCDLCDYSGFKLVTLNMAYMTYFFFWHIQYSLAMSIIYAMVKVTSLIWLWSHVIICVTYDYKCCHRCHRSIFLI